MTLTANDAGSSSAWQNRIVGSGTEAPDQLLANPQNWRIHPQHQQALMEGVLDTIGWVQQVIVNRRTGHLVDGHLRVHIALRRGEPTIPVVYVDLSLDEERAILASFDPIGSLAVRDDEKIAELLADVNATHGPLAAQLSKMLEVDTAGAGAAPSDGSLLKLLEVTIAEPRHVVSHGDRWSMGLHLLVCADPIVEWPAWRDDLREPERDAFCPYPGPLVPLTVKASKWRLVLVQPDPYIAGHMLDRWEDVHREEPDLLPLHLNPSPVEQVSAEEMEPTRRRGAGGRRNAA